MNDRSTYERFPIRPAEVVSHEDGLTGGIGTGNRFTDFKDLTSFRDVFWRLNVLAFVGYPEVPQENKYEGDEADCWREGRRWRLESWQFFGGNYLVNCTFLLLLRREEGHLPQYVCYFCHLIRCLLLSVVVVVVV